MNYYNEFDPFAAAWLRNLIADSLIPKGDVDDRDIRDVDPKDLKGYTQCHFFTGIAGWSLALQLAGWPDARPVWTGSPPCQPFSAIGNQLGTTQMINSYISSSNIARVGWANKVLYVEFNHGGVYAYKNADFKVYADLIAAESAGQHFHQNIRYAYEYTKLDYDPFAPRVKAKTNSEFQYREKLETKKMRVEKLLQKA